MLSVQACVQGCNTERARAEEEAGRGASACAPAARRGMLDTVLLGGDSDSDSSSEDGGNTS